MTCFTHNTKFPGKTIIFGKANTSMCSLLAIGTRCIFGNGEKKGLMEKFHILTTAKEKRGFSRN